MPAKLTTEEVLSSFKEAHGNLYSYPNFEYINSTTLISILCKEHGIFRQTPKKHRTGQGCRKCSHRKVYRPEEGKTSTDLFIEQSRAVHGSTYSYENAHYVSSDVPLDITCKVHGSFTQRPRAHINKGSGCPGCGSISRRSSSSYFLDRLRKVHGDRYTLVGDYITSRCKLTLRCKEHGNFDIYSRHLYQGSGCPVCGYISIALKTHRNTHKKRAWFYLAEVRYNGHICYKFGYTTQRDAADRFRGTSTVVVSLVETVEGPIREVLWREMQALSFHKKARTIDLPRRFKGRTECFDIPISEALDTFDHLSRNL